VRSRRVSPFVDLALTARADAENLIRSETHRQRHGLVFLTSRLLTSTSAAAASLLETRSPVQDDGEGRDIFSGVDGARNQQPFAIRETESNA
jgi:hypothetical protein